MSDLDIPTRLQTLDRKLGTAEARLKNRSLDISHANTARDLRRRLDALEAQVAAESITAEAQGHHVSDLEHAIRLWFDRLSDAA